MVTTTENEYIASRYEGHTRWLVELNDGTKCYQDDGRPDCEEISGWVRLKAFCQAKGLHIIGMYLQFRKETVALPLNKSGYYFCNASLGWMGGGPTFQYYVVGYIENGKILAKRYKVPELIVEEEEIREIKQDDVCLIRKDS